MSVQSINPKDISVVVQGALAGEITKLCLESIRTYLPGAEIILSTWEGSNVQGLDYDQLVQNHDPGGFDYHNCEYPIKCNVNRQLYSTLQGLKQASRLYAVKIRTDFVLRSSDFLQWFGKFPARDKEYSYFREKVICCDVYSRNPRYSNYSKSYVVHPADFFFFGYTSDLVDLFDIPLVPREDQIYFSIKNRETVAQILPRFLPEQWLWVEFLRKHLSDSNQLPKDFEDISPELISLTERTFAANLLLLSEEQIGLDSGKPSVYIYEPESCFTHKDWRALYAYFCKGNPFPYFLYRVKTTIKNQMLSVKQWMIHFGRRAVAFLKRHLVPRLPQVQKEWLKLRYRKMKGTLFPNYLQGYVESFYQEDVSDENLSVVVQGSVSAATVQTLESIRTLLPRAEIVLSTWEGTDTTGLDYDKLVLSSDPGSSGFSRRYPYKQINNVNRIIVSSYEGVKAATKRYCLKLRSDMLLESNKFLDYYNRYSRYISPRSPFARRVMVEGLSTTESLTYAVSDWYYFGLREDIIRIFDIPLYSNENIPYFEMKQHMAEKPKYETIICQYLPKQYITYRFLKKVIHPMPEFKHAFIRMAEHEEIFRQFIAGSLLCVEFSESGIILPKAGNMANPVSYTYNIPFSKWALLCTGYHTLPNKLLGIKQTREESDSLDEYRRKRRYCEIENWSRVVYNYAKPQTISEYHEAEKTISQEDITFVISGEVDLSGPFNTHRCIESVRRFFPTSKIILSTWEQEPVSTLIPLCDQVLLSKAPKERECRYVCDEDNPDKRINSINKQQFSVHAGLKQVRTKYAVRLRTDCYLINDNFLSFYEKWIRVLNKYDSEYQIFENRVLVPYLFTRDPRNDGGCYPYQLSDCFQFGLTEDLIKLWDGHRESFQTLNYFNDHPNSKYHNPARFNSKYTPEQYFFLNAIRNAGLKVLFPKYYLDTSSERIVFEAEKVFASNVIVANCMQLGMQSTFNFCFDPRDTRFYSLNRIVEEYLYNIDPTNEECLGYLERYYTEPESAQEPKEHILRRCIAFTKRCTHSIRQHIKAILRAVLPGYRVACGVRELQFNHEQITAEQFNYLVYRLDQLQQTVKRQEEQLKHKKDLKGNCIAFRKKDTQNRCRIVNNDFMS